VWIAQRLVSTRVEAYLRQESDIRRQVGIGLGMSLGRAFVVGLSILAVGLLGARADGAMAAILVLAAFTVYFVTSLVIRPLERNTPRP
jgi:multisubunit Na+/H+ antiporter MnhB subunit